MISIGRYIVFILSVTGMVLSVDKFTEKEMENFLQHIFVLHNTHRIKHGVPKLLPDDDISKLAGDTLRNVSTGATHNFPEGYGVNFTFMDLNDETKLDANEAKEVFSIWYDTGKNYDYDSNPSNNDADKFTQIVWRSTTHLGLGIVLHEEIGKYAILALYTPPGNKKKQFKANVSPPQ